MLVYLCLSSHGFGHAARQAVILRELQRLRPSWKFVVSSVVQAQFLKIIFEGINVIHRKVKWDVGTFQTNALDIDLKRTEIDLACFEDEIMKTLSKEILWIKEQQSKVLIISDISPYAIDLSREVNANLIWICNFGWDDIYRGKTKLLDYYSKKYTIKYSQGDLLLRLPFSFGMEWNIPTLDIGLTASKKKKLPKKFIEKITSYNKELIMICFGGIGLDFPSNLFSLWPDYNFLISDSDYSRNFFDFDKIENVFSIPSQNSVNDAMQHCSRIICKPGYSTFCEAIISGVGLHVVERKDFAEADILINSLEEFGNYKLLSKHSFEKGLWKLDETLKPLSNIKRINNGGNEASMAIIEFVSRNNISL